MFPARPGWTFRASAISARRFSFPALPSCGGMSLPITSASSAASTTSSSAATNSIAATTLSRTPFSPVVSSSATCPAAFGLAASPATINPLQSASLGLPQFYQQGFGDPIYNYPRPFTAAFIQDQWSMTSNFTLNVGVRYELDSQYGALSSDKNNFAPRVSIAWDPFKDHKTAIRAGYGIFYSPIYGQIADVVQTLGE